jgi:hypothetical protein
MSNIDLTMMITSHEREAEALALRAGALKLEVQQRIFDVVDQNTQASLLAAMVAGTMTPEQQATFVAGQQWIEDTKAAGRAAAATGNDPIWPPIPEGVAELAALY